MRQLASIAVILILSPGVAPAGDALDLQGYLTGALAELERPETPIPIGAHEILYPDGTLHALGEKKGKVLLVNLWSAGCVPCRDEMPDLARLHEDLGDDRFEVVALPMEKRKLKAVRKTLRVWGASNLTPYRNDPQALAQALRAAGLFTESSIHFAYPTTYVVNRAGNIVAIREGFLEWDTPEARALIAALKSQEP